MALQNSFTLPASTVVVKALNSWPITFLSSCMYFWLPCCGVPPPYPPPQDGGGDESLSSCPSPVLRGRVREGEGDRRASACYSKRPTMATLDTFSRGAPPRLWVMPMRGSLSWRAPARP